MTTIAVVSAGMRSPSTTKQLADDLAAAVVSVTGGATVVHIEVRDHVHAIADAHLSGFASGALTEALAQVEDAHALVVVTPTYQGSYAGMFKAFFDLVGRGSLRGKPVLLAATGGSERHALMIEAALRPLFAYFGAWTVPTGVFATPADVAEGERLARRIERAASELADRLLDSH